MAKQDGAGEQRPRRVADAASSEGSFNCSEAISDCAADATGFAADSHCALSGLAPVFVKTDTGWRIFQVHNTPINREAAHSNTSRQLARIESLLTELLLLLEKIAGEPWRRKE